MGVAELQSPPFSMYVLPLVASTVPPMVVLSTLSQLSPFAAGLISSLAAVPKLIGLLHLHLLVYTALALAALTFWLVTRRHPVGPTLWWTSCSIWYLCWVAAAVLALPHFPVFAATVLATSGCVLLFPIRFVHFPSVDPMIWFQAAGLAQACAALWALGAWIAWLVINLPGRQTISDWPPEFGAMVKSKDITWKTALVAWILPLEVALVLGLAAVLCFLRVGHLRKALVIEAQAEGAKRNLYIVAAVRHLSMWIAALALLMWLDAAWAATFEVKYEPQREDLRDEVLALALATYVVLLLWTIDTLGVQEFEAASRESKLVQATVDFLWGDWARGGILFVMVVPLVFCAVFDRIWKRERAVLSFTAGWSWTSIVIKATLLGLLYIFVAVGCAKFFAILLAYINELLSSWPVFAVSGTLFVLGYLLFLCPVSPGPPIYMVMGIVMVSSATRQGWRFEAAVTWATAVAQAMKLAFTTTAQVVIGEPLATNKTVRQLCQLHTPYMKAVQQLLSQPGLTLAKVAILVGGPDWPVAVLCGILRLSRLEVLAGTFPVLFQSVFPCVLCGALMLTYEDQNSLGAAEMVMCIAILLQAAAGVIAFYHVQEVLEKDYAELSKIRKEDEELVREEKEESRLMLAFWNEFSWTRLPILVKLSLAIGFVSAEIAVCLLVGPWDRLMGSGAFKTFGLTDSLTKDLGGNPFNIVQPLGLAALCCTGVSCLAIGIFYGYTKVAKVGDEAAPLVADP